MRARSLRDGNNRRVVSVAARGVRATLDSDNRPMYLVGGRRCAVSLDVHETPARKVAAVQSATRCAGG